MCCSEPFRGMLRCASSSDLMPQLNASDAHHVGSEHFDRFSAETHDVHSYVKSDEA